MAGGAIPCDPRRRVPEGTPISSTNVDATTLAVDLRGRYVAFGWRFRGGSSFGVGDVTEIRLTRIGTRSSTVLAGKSEGGAADDECPPTPLWPSLGATTVSWLESSGPDQCARPVAAIVRRALAKPTRFESAQLRGPHLSLALEGRKALAIQARGARPYDFSSPPPANSCNEPERTCELISFAPPTFARMRTRANRPDALCWTLDVKRAATECA